MPFGVALAALASLPWILLIAAAPPARGQTTLPTGFGDSLVVKQLDIPAAFDFVPGSTASKWRLLLVEQKSARVRLVVNGAMSATDPVLTVPNVRTTGGEQGLLGVAVDPQFPARPYLYVHADDDRSANIRISRFTLTGDLLFLTDGHLSASAASRMDLVTNIPDAAENHNGGTVRFGPDGLLYVSIGDDASGCAAQDTVSLRGVILRLRTDALPSGAGTALRSQIVPAGNPYAAYPDSNQRLVWALGLRNPFRFQVDPPTGRLVIADVGNNQWEEIDIASAGGTNFGWPFREGFVNFGSCPRSSTGIVDPIVVMGHPAALSIMSAGIYRPVAGAPLSWPAEYDGDLFYSDYYGGMLRRLHFDGASWVPAPAPGQPGANDWGWGFDAVTDYRIGPDGGLWYLRQGGNPDDGSGEIRRIVWTDAPPDTSPPPPARPGVALTAWPVPMRTTLTLGWTMPLPGRVTLAVFDTRGRLVRRLVAAGVMASGSHTATWDGLDTDGRRVPAGLYWARLEVGDDRRTVRLPLAP